MTTPPPVIVACIPVDTSTLPKLPPGSPPMPTPTHLYSLTKCHNPACRQDMWIGPRQKTEYDNRGSRDMALLCYQCAAILATLLTDGYDVRDLGGGAGVEGVPRVTPAGG